MRAFQEAYPNPPTIQPRRVVGSGDVWVVEARSGYGDGRIYHVAMIVELRDGKIWRDTRYYAQPFEAPEWRAQWVEHMEESAAARRHPKAAAPCCGGLATSRVGTEDRPHPLVELMTIATVREPASSFGEQRP